MFTKIEKIRDTPNLSGRRLTGDSYEFIGSLLMDCSSFEGFRKDVIECYKDWVDSASPHNDGNDSPNPMENFDSPICKAKFIYCVLESYDTAVYFKIHLKKDTQLTLGMIMYAHATSNQRLLHGKKTPTHNWGLSLRSDKFLYQGCYLVDPVGESVICKFRLRRVGC